MMLLPTLGVALSALGRNKLRSGLTMLGIIIGIFAVITTVALGEGAKAQAQETFAAMGTNLLIVLPGTSQTGGSRGGFGSGSTLTWDDMKAISAELGSVRWVSPGLRTTTSIVGENANWTTQVWGVSPEYFDIRNWPTSTGARFTQSDVDTGNKVVVLGVTVVDKLFGDPDADPVGQSVRIRNIPFTIIGVAKKKGQSQMGQDYDDQVMIPVSTFATKLQGGLRNYINGMIYVAAVSADATSVAEREIGGLLRDRHRLAPGIEDDFNVRNLAEFADMAQQQTRTTSLLILCIGAISLFVGGIGIMNIMLVSVTERTREIGLRMAVGAKPNAVMFQFLIESLLLSLIGGLVGLAIGIATVFKAAAVLNWPVLIRYDSVLISIGFSALVGIVFGIYPAYKASRLDPIDALRYE